MTSLTPVAVLTADWHHFVNRKCCIPAGIDVDIDVEHEGQRTKVTTPLQSERAEEDMGAGAKGGAEVEADCNTSEGAKVSSSE